MRGLKTVPNLLTLVRVLLIPVFLFVSFRGMFLTAFVLFITAAFTDILDGILARWLDQRSRIGAILDPAADKTMLISGYLYYTFARNLTMRIPGWLTLTVFIRDFLIIIFAYLLYTRVQVKRFPPSWAGKTSTVLQAAALAAVIGVNASIPKLIWLAEPLFRLSLLMTLFSGGHYVRRARVMLLESAAA
jgi:cardiolipin synthase (CMP-forming)